MGAVVAAGIAVAVAVRDDDAQPDVALVGGPVDLPFGMEQVEGTEPIGRPAVFERVALIRNGEPVTGLTLRAAYRVTADDPLAVVRVWADQLDGLALERVWVSQALLDEAMAASDHGETDGVETVPAEGDVEVLTADFVISAGGWGFDVVAVEGPGDDAATLYVTSYAD